MAISMISLDGEYASQNDIDVSALEVFNRRLDRKGKVAEVWPVSYHCQRAEFPWGREEI